jgi:putative ABC transport system substrate-binding protein
LKRIALVNPTTKPGDMRIGGDPIYATILEEMKRLGYVESVDVIVDRYSAEGQPDRFPEIAHEIAITRPDVIVALGNFLTQALLSETRTIPIVTWTTDPIAAGFVSSLARPGGNVTGVSVDAGAEVASKRIALFAEAVGKLANVRLLGVPASWQSAPTAFLREAAPKLGISLRLEPLQSPINEAEYRRAFEAMKRDQVDGVIIGSDGENYTNRVLLGRMAREYHLSSISPFRDVVEAGGLMSYAFDIKAGARRQAAQIVEILKGAKPADMPYFQEAHFELAINLKAAKELGLELSPGLVARADEVIE